MHSGPQSAPAGSFSEIFRIAIPLVLSSGSLSLMIFVDRMYLAWHSMDALAAALPAAALHWAVVSIAFGTGTYVNAFIAQYEGAGRKDRVAASLWQGVYLALVSGGLLLIFVPLAGPIFSLVGHDPAVRDMEAAYFSILCAGGTATVLAAVVSCFYSGRGHTMVVLYVNVSVLLMNVVLDYCLIFGPGPFPAWGIRGAAIATIFANVAAVTIYITLMTRPNVLREYPLWIMRRFDRELFGRLIRYGLPNGLQFGVDVGAFSLFIFLVGTIGKQQLAATNLAFNLNALAFIPMMGFGIAVMTLVGKRIGEGRPELAVQTTWKAFGLAGGYLLAFGGVVVVFPDLMISPFAMYIPAEQFAPVREHVIVLLRFVALFTFFDGMAIIFGSAVRGAGDTRFSLLFTFVTSWSLMVLPTAVAWMTIGLSLNVGWSACTIYVIVLGVGFVLRFQAGRWKSMQIIERDSAEADPMPSLLPEGDLAVESV